MKSCIVKSILGVILICASVAGLFYWEAAGRERWTMVEVVAAAEDIEPGTRLTKSIVKSIRVSEEDLVSRAMTSIPENLLNAGRANQFIPANAQLSTLFFETGEALFEKGRTLFVIERSWIASRSSTLRAGDFIRIYSADGLTDFGSYKAVLVKDEKEAEVADGENGMIESDVLNRRNPLSQISHVEILAELAQYEAIRGFIEEGGRLLLVQEDGHE